jgi:hypothetical protein
MGDAFECAFPQLSKDVTTFGFAQRLRRAAIAEKLRQLSIISNFLSIPNERLTVAALFDRGGVGCFFDAAL